MSEKNLKVDSMSEKDIKVSAIASRQAIDTYDNLLGNLDIRYKNQVYEKLGHGNLEEDVTIDEAEFIFKKADEMPIEEAIKILKDAIDYHLNDPNFDQIDYQLIQKLVLGAEENQDMSVDEWAFQTKMMAALNEYHSPYSEVRAIASCLDDPTIPVETIRAYFLGFLWSIIGTAINEFFSHRKPSITLSSSVCQMLLYPCGKALEKILPDAGFTMFGSRHSLNPGPWSYKEQMFATIVFNVAIGTMYVSSNIYVQKLGMFYDSKWVTIGYQALLAISTQTLGFGFAGILRKVAIYPKRAVWPTLLPTIALNQALLKPEHKERINGWTISKYNFFLVTFCGSFAYYWVPNFLFEALSTFNWMTWIKPDNFNLAVITGSVSGLGLNPIASFDWNIISYVSPLSIPFYSLTNQVIGSFIAFFCIIGVYYTNNKWTGYLPVNSNDIYSNVGESYEVKQILTNGKLDEEKYKKYGPPYYSAANLVVYGAYFAMYPFTIIYTFYSEWKAISSAMKSLKGMFTSFSKSNFENFQDPHSRMMAKYKETPDWWFFIILIISIVFAILCVKLYPVETPVWGIFFTIGINFLFLIPLTIIYSITGFSFGLNVLVELIIGYALPGNGNALMTLKAFGYNIGGQAENFVTDQKMAHYAKIPPRAIFRGQLIAVGLQIIVSLAIINWQMTGITGICTASQPSKFSCPNEVTYYSASVLWGVIGPKRVFDTIYPVLKYCFLIGAVLAFVCIAIKKFFPKQTIHFQPTLILSGFLYFAPYNLSYVLPGFMVCYVFNYHIKRRYQAWWEKYNYILASGLNTGVAFSAIIVFFAVQFHPVNLNWWGNIVSFSGIDGGALPRTSLLNATALAPDGYFGLRFGTFT